MFFVFFVCFLSSCAPGSLLLNPLNDGVMLSRSECEVECADETVARICYRINMLFARCEENVMDEALERGIVLEREIR